MIFTYYTHFGIEEKRSFVNHTMKFKLTML